MPRHPGDVQREAFARGDDFRPDWASYWTKEKMEQECEGFQFKGPGWYFQKGMKHAVYTTLVLPTPDPKVFLFCSYGERNPTNIFNWIVNAPVRVDER